MGKISHGIACPLRCCSSPFELQFMQVSRPVDTEKLTSKTHTGPKTLIFRPQCALFGFSTRLVCHENPRLRGKQLTESRA